MIEYLRGKLTRKTPTYVVVECGGLGYFVAVSLTTYSAIADSDEVTLYTHYAVSVDIRSGESRHQLFGFDTEQERELFRLLTSVSGISSHIAMMFLSGFKPAEIESLILNGDARSLTAVKGVGPKLAQKVVTELREKIAKGGESIDKLAGSDNSLRNEALSALLALGFDRAASAKVINKVMSDANPKSVEELIKMSLKQF